MDHATPSFRFTAGVVVGLLPALAMMFVAGMYVGGIETRLDQHDAWIAARDDVKIDARLSRIEGALETIDKRLDRLEGAHTVKDGTRP